MNDYTATCHTPDCGNNGVPIPVQWDDAWGPGPNVSCGVCGQPITDVTPTEATPTEEENDA